MTECLFCTLWDVTEKSIEGLPVAGNCGNKKSRFFKRVVHYQNHCTKAVLE